MRVLLPLACLALAGCVVTKHQLTSPNVAARFDSAKSPEEVAKCAAAALPDYRLTQAGTAWMLMLKEGIVEKVRWDFFPTAAGSQAELRNGSKGDGGVAAVRGCV